MRDKMASSAYILKIVQNDPFLRLQMRAKEDLNPHQLFSTNWKNNSVVHLWLELKNSFIMGDQFSMLAK